MRRAFSATVWSRDGRLMSAKVASDGQWRFFPTDSVPEKFRVAITTYEDKRFYRHFGVDPLALGRAVRQNLAAGRITSGASTLTMQTIRLSRGGKPRTFREKFVEMVLATRLELRCSKDEILALYASHAPFGGNVVGLESAAWYYFGRSAAQLSWAECVMLAVLPNSPSLIHIRRNRERLREKRDGLLDRIWHDGRIDSLTCALAKQEHLPDAPEPMPMAELERSIEEVKRVISVNENIRYKYSTRFLAIKLLENDGDLEKIVQEFPNGKDIIEVRNREEQRLRNAINEDSEQAITDAKYGFISGALRETYVDNHEDTARTTRVIDSIVTHRVWGYPIFFL